MFKFSDSFSLLGETHLAEVSLQYRDEVVDGGNDTWFLLIPVAAVALSYLILRVYNRRPSVVNTPTGLLTEICYAHGLGGRAIQMLHKIARAAELPQPATMLMSPEAFETTLASASRRIRFGNAEQKTIGMVRRNIFAT